MGIFRAALFAAALIGCGSVWAAGENLADFPSIEVASAESPQDVYLQVQLNGQPTSMIVHFRVHGRQLHAAARDLDDIGLDIDRLGLGGAADVSLDAIPGLRYTYDVARQVVELYAEDAIRKPYSFDTRALPNVPEATSSSGLFVNYNVYAQTGSSRQVALVNEAHYFNPTGVLSTSGIGYLTGSQRRYLRYDTSFSRSVVSAPSTVQLGDAITSSLAWSRSIRIGGFQWRSNFALRPDLVTFPVPALYGSAVVPSSVDVYVNNIRQYSGNVPSGPFIMHNVPGITGAGIATIVTRDALGRTISTSAPLYIDPRLLAAGLSSYSFEAGVVRRDYGVQSFSYDPHPAVSGSVRYGLTDRLTLEGHAEATHGLVNAGAGALMRIGQWGVVNGSLSVSAMQFAGSQMSLGYQLVQPCFSIDARAARTYGNFGDIASSNGTPTQSAVDQLTVSLPLVRRQAISLSYIGSKYPGTAASRIGSIAYTLNLGDLISLNLNAYKDFRQRNASGVFVTLSLGFLHDISVNAVAGRSNGDSEYDFNAARTPDYAGGWGWGVQAGGTAGTPYRQAQVQYLGNNGEVTVLAQRLSGVSTASLDMTGALVLMDRSVEFSRRIDDGFALVSTDGVSGIPVSHDNRLIGVTDRSGHLLVPDLNAYQHNEVSIDGMKLPPNARISATSMDVSPQSLSGVVAHFGITRYRAASVVLVDASGKVIASGTQVRDEESGKSTIVGYDGVSFVDSLRSDNHLVIGSGAARCGVQFAFAPSRDDSLPTIGPLTCRRLPGAPQ